MAILTVENLRSIQWDKSNLWDISIAGGPSKFSAFIPANDISLGFWGVGTEQIGATGLEFPATHTVPTFNLSYYDDETLSMTKFFTDWMKSLVSPDGYKVKMLHESTKLFTISKLLSTKSVNKSWIFDAFPTGNIEYHGESDGSAPIYTINFIVAADRFQE